MCICHLSRSLNVNAFRLSVRLFFPSLFSNPPPYPSFFFFFASARSYTHLHTLPPFAPVPAFLRTHPRFLVEIGIVPDLIDQLTRTVHNLSRRRTLTLRCTAIPLYSHPLVIHHVSFATAHRSSDSAMNPTQPRAANKQFCRSRILCKPASLTSFSHDSEI